MEDGVQNVTNYGKVTSFLKRKHENELCSYIKSDKGADFIRTVGVSLLIFHFAAHNVDNDNGDEQNRFIDADISQALHPRDSSFMATPGVKDGCIDCVMPTISIRSACCRVNHYSQPLKQLFSSFPQTSFDRI